jgi:aspartyl-tRNA(Asn)/glutamyl-tRNA(Gln) amidotransferase subunit A
MRETLDRIDATHDALGALVALRERDDLLADARRAEGRYAQGYAGALEGLPLGVKDLQDAEGLPTTQGSLVFRNNMATHDSVEVGRLRTAGAIVVGKTNTPEWGHTAITKNLVHGVTRNPWNLELTPGGSSGGSAAAIAAGVLPLSTATDGGGSVRIPASFTGCFGLKPSFGRVPHPNDYWIMGDTSVPGQLTRSVEDAARQLDASVGPHPLEPGLRIGWAPDLCDAVVQSDIAAVSLEAARVFEQLGHDFREHDIPLPALGRDWGMMNAFESLGELAPHIEANREAFGRSFLRGVEAGRHMTPELWGELRRQRGVLNRWCADSFERFDLLLTPTVPYDPPPAKGPFPEKVEGRPQPATGVAAFTIPFNLSWHPAASVRAGFSDAGLPVGLQIVGPRHRDDLVLQASRAFERERPWQAIWPDV